MELAILALQIVILVVVLIPHATVSYRHLAARRAGLRLEAGTLQRLNPAPLPEGHQWPQKADEFDGVWESWACRAHGELHARRRYL